MNNQKTIQEKTKTEEKKTEGDGKGLRNENSADPGAAFRRSSLLPRSPPAKSATSRSITGSGPARAALGNIIADSPVSGNSHTDVSIQKKDAPSTSIRGWLQPAQNTPTGTLTAAAQLVTPTPASGGAVTIATVESASMDAIEISPRLELIKKTRRMEEDAISQCKLVVSAMQLAFRRQKNTSNEVKVGVSKMAELLDVALNYRRSWRAAEDGRASPNPRRSAAAQQIADTPTSAAINPKRTATSPAAPESYKKARANEHSGNKTGSPGKKGEEWQTVAKRGNQKKAKEKKAEPNKKSKPRTQRAKPEAVVIKPAEGHSYADVLKDLRAKITTDESVKVRSVRKTKAGAILLEFGRGEKVTPEFVHQLRSTVQETASIAELKPSATVEIRDLDSLTVKAEVETAVRKLLMNQEEQIQTRITAPNAREQVRAFLTLSAEGAAKLIEIGDIKIGWIRAKMRACEQIKRCYRCLGIGHTQANCTGPDRRDTCIRCGKPGHKIKDCKAAPNCIHCADAKRDRADHLPGSRRCPLAKKR